MHVTQKSHDPQFLFKRVKQKKKEKRIEQKKNAFLFFFVAPISIVGNSHSFLCRIGGGGLFDNLCRGQRQKR